MSLISCPLFTLQLKSYCSKIYSTLAAAWLIPRLTLTKPAPSGSLHGSACTLCASQTTAKSIPGLELFCLLSSKA